MGCRGQLGQVTETIWLIKNKRGEKEHFKDRACADGFLGTRKAKKKRSEHHVSCLRLRVALSFFRMWFFVATDATYWNQAISEGRGKLKGVATNGAFSEAPANKRSSYHPVVSTGFWVESGVLELDRPVVYG
jgi:hypothetical protein